MPSSATISRSDPRQRRLPVGAELVPGGVEFRVWAPRHRSIDVHFEDAQGRPGERHALAEEEDGYFSAVISEVGAGARYRFALDGDSRRFPDPASRFQPMGPHGPSLVVDPGAFRWRDAGWSGVALEHAVIHETHIGTFTPEGTWTAAATQLATLADVGVTVIELMPLADFPGRFGWGYDGVNHYAPTRLYGTPDDLRRFVDEAHALGIAVVLDVVYNHVGPDGNFLPEFSDAYFSATHETEWGRALNFDGDDSGPVREFVLANAGYWVDEFHIDGLRIDATQSLVDESRPHILTEIADRVRAAAAGRTALLIAENEPQNVRMLRPPSEDGHGLDAAWNDDFHHSAIVALTGRDEAYYTDYGGTPQELISAAKHGYLYQGQRYEWQNNRRGTPTRGIRAPRFVHYLENHDQIANSLDGRRLHERTSPGRYRAVTALLLLSPQTPMLFQGQDYGSTSPFVFFADHGEELAASVQRGRADFLSQFPSIARPETRARIPRPDDPATFERCRLEPGERAANAEFVALHRDLLRLRRDDAVLRRRGADGLDGAVLGPDALVLRYFGPEGDDRLLLVNLGAALHLRRVPEPLLAPPESRRWVLAWSSDDARYGGLGSPPVESEDGRWEVPAESAVLLRGSAGVNDD